MAMFSTAGRSADRPPTPRPHSPEPGLSIIAHGTCIKGELEVDGVIRIEGRIEGSVRAEGQVLVVKGGSIEGDIFTRHAIIGGEVRGGLFADERVEIQATSVINGDITTPQLSIEEGGKVNGQLRMANPQALSRKQPAPPGHLRATEKQPALRPREVAELKAPG